MANCDSLRKYQLKAADLLHMWYSTYSTAHNYRDREVCIKATAADDRDTVCTVQSMSGSDNCRG